jgi:hypothetical protein
MSVVVLFSILFQSVHTFEHLIEQLSEKKCLHKNRFVSDITHEHDNFDDCFVCEFSFSAYIAFDLNQISFNKSIDFIKKDSHFFKESNHFYSGISYSLRGPPII